MQPTPLDQDYASFDGSISDTKGESKAKKWFYPALFVAAIVGVSVAGYAMNTTPLGEKERAMVEQMPVVKGDSSVSGAPSLSPIAIPENPFCDAVAANLDLDDDEKETCEVIILYNLLDNFDDRKPLLTEDYQIITYFAPWWPTSGVFTGFDEAKERRFINQGNTGELINQTTSFPAVTDILFVQNNILGASLVQTGFAKRVTNDDPLETTLVPYENRVLFVITTNKAEGPRKISKWEIFDQRIPGDTSVPVSSNEAACDTVEQSYAQVCEAGADSPDSPDSP